jgi:superfamily II DNA or RNA helicase
MVCPTGGGKTVMFSYMAQRAVAKGGRVVILVHRDELIDQVASTLHRFNVPCTFVAPGRKYRHNLPVVVASVFTLKNRLDIVHSPSLVIVDEAHHATAKSSWGRVLNTWAGSKTVGVTATPQRLSGEGLNELFDEMVVGPSTADLISAGHLSPYEYYCPNEVDLTGVGFSMGDYNKHDLDTMMNKPGVTGSAVEHYRKLAHGKRAIVFCVSLKHCAAVRDQYQGAGYRAEIIDGTMDKGARRALVTRFASGELDQLVSCDVVSEGFDLPAIEVVQMLRPTASTSLCLQQWGRGLRTFAGKTHAMILDHVGNCRRHMFPDSDREWSLEGKKRKKKDAEQKLPIRLCPVCFRALPGGTQVCNCGHRFAPQPREVAQKQGELVKVSAQMKLALQTQRKQEQSSAKTYEELVALGQSRGYRFPREWALKIMASRKTRTRNTTTTTTTWHH